MICIKTLAKQGAGVYCPGLSRKRHPMWEAKVTRDPDRTTSNIAPGTRPEAGQKELVLWPRNLLAP